MTAHALLMAGEALEALCLILFVIALAECARERRAVKIPIRSQDRRR